MQILKNTQIKNKIILIIFIIGAISTLTISTINYFYELNKIRKQIISNSLLQATLLSEYCGLPLEFNYPENATEVLGKLFAIPGVYDGVLFTNDNTVFASYHKTQDHINQIPDNLKGADYSIEGNYIHVLKPVIYHGKTYGNLYIRSYIDWKGIGSEKLLVTFLIILIILMFTYSLAYSLQGHISNPIVKLTGEMNLVAETKDYTIQFPVSGTDEISDLYKGFNTMLSEILKRDLAFNLEKERAETYLNIAEVIILALDRNARISLLNRKGYQILGYELGELEGKEWIRVCIPLEKAAKTETIFNEIFSGENLTSAYHENLILTKKGEKRMIAWHNTFFSDKNGNRIGTLSCGEDITERKRAELLLLEKTKEIESQNEEYHRLNDELIKINKELITAKEHAEESDRLKSAFLANMSHEIRTPMNGILGFTSLLFKPNLSTDQKENYIKIVHKSGQRLLNTVNDIVEISKIEAGMVSVNTEDTNINRKVEEIVRFFIPEATAKRLELIIETLLPESKSIIITDTTKLESILTNLIKNAIKYTDSGSIKIGCLLRNNKVEFYVRDTGIGIPGNRHKAIFDRFVQADIEDKRALHGSGLGLTITKAFVELLGGIIWVESEPGKGSCFCFTLPFNQKTNEKEGDGPVLQNNIIEFQENHQINGLKILISEDDEVSDMLISLELNPFSREILKSRTGIEAIEICRKNPDIDLVLMDIKMPEMDGYEATKQIRKFNREIIIIAQTAYGLTGDREKAISAGCNDYISKPINKVELYTIIQKYFSSNEANFNQAE